MQITVGGRNINIQFDEEEYCDIDAVIALATSIIDYFEKKERYND